MVQQVNEAVVPVGSTNAILMLRLRARRTAAGSGRLAEPAHHLGDAARPYAHARRRRPLQYAIHGARLTPGARATSCKLARMRCP